MSARFVLAMYPRRIAGAFIVFMAAVTAASFAISTAMTPPVRYDYLDALHSTPDRSDFDFSWAPGGQPVGRDASEAERQLLGDLLGEVLSGHYLTSPRSPVTDGALTRLTSERSGGGTMTLRLSVTAQADLVQLDGSLFAMSLSSRRVHLSRGEGGVLEVSLDTAQEIARVRATPRGLRLHHLEPGAQAEPLGVSGQGVAELFEPAIGFNYYPASAPWTDFWTQFPEEEIEADFAEMKQIGANTVRIFLSSSAFARPEDREESLPRLERLLDRAESHDLKVILTSFDMGLDYSPAAWPAAWSQLDDILETVSLHPAVLALDLKNEPDLDYDAAGQDVVDGFLTAMAGMVHAEYPGLPVTVGWSAAEHAARLPGVADLVSFHDFEDPATLGERLAEVRARAGGRPVLVTEIGHTRQFPFGSDGAQADAYALQLEALEGSAGVLVWTLRDFDEVPSTVAGWQPWRRAMQSRYGLSSESLARFSLFAIQNQNQKPDHGVDQ